jgi:hypothetical protein
MICNCGATVKAGRAFRLAVTDPAAERAMKAASGNLPRPRAFSAKNTPPDQVRGHAFRDITG